MKTPSDSLPVNRYYLVDDGPDSEPAWLGDCEAVCRWGSFDRFTHLGQYHLTRSEAHAEINRLNREWQDQVLELAKKLTRRTNT